MNFFSIGATANKIISSFGWMLIHSLWQGLAITIIAAILLWLAKKSGALIRYWLLFVLSIVFLVVCLLTFIWECNSWSGQSTQTSITGNIGVNISALFLNNLTNLKQTIKIWGEYFSANTPFIVLMWFIFFLFKSMKFISSIVYNQRVKNYRVFEPSEFWTDKTAMLSGKLKIKKTVKLLQSGYIKMPVVIGHVKPVILIPIGIMTGLPVEQVEAILLHELAHIRRNDYFVNVLQNIVETVFFFNPGLLWLSSMLSEERENCCDDIALEQTQNKQGFIEALISFKEYELYGSNYATAFPGRKNQLINRVSRILNNRNKTIGFSERAFLIISTLLLLIIGTSAAVACINKYTKAGLKQPHYNVTHVIQQTVQSKHPKEIKKVRIAAIREQAQVTKKMQHGISGIVENKEPSVTVIEKKKPVATVLPVQAVADQIQAKKDQGQAIVVKELAMADMARAEVRQKQAVNSQVSVKLSQVQVLTTVIQAKINQQRVMKEKAEADSVHQKIN